MRKINKKFLAVMMTALVVSVMTPQISVLATFMRIKFSLPSLPDSPEVAVEKLIAYNPYTLYDNSKEELIRTFTLFQESQDFRDRFKNSQDFFYISGTTWDASNALDYYQRIRNAYLEAQKSYRFNRASFLDGAPIMLPTTSTLGATIKDTLTSQDPEFWSSYSNDANVRSLIILDNTMATYLQDAQFYLKACQNPNYLQDFFNTINTNRDNYRTMPETTQLVNEPGTNTQPSGETSGASSGETSGASSGETSGASSGETSGTSSGEQAQPPAEPPVEEPVVEPTAQPEPKPNGEMSTENPAVTEAPANPDTNMTPVENTQNETTALPSGPAEDNPTTPVDPTVIRETNTPTGSTTNNDTPTTGTGSGGSNDGSTVTAVTNTPTSNPTDTSTMPKETPGNNTTKEIKPLLNHNPKIAKLLRNAMAQQENTLISPAPQQNQNTLTSTLLNGIPSATPATPNTSNTLTNIPRPLIRTLLNRISSATPNTSNTLTNTTNSPNVLPSGLSPETLLRALRKGPATDVLNSSSLPETRLSRPLTSSGPFRLNLSR